MQLWCYVLHLALVVRITSYWQCVLHLAGGAYYMLRWWRVLHVALVVHITSCLAGV